MAKILRHLRNVGTPYVGRKAAERTGAANTLTAPEVQTYPDRPGTARRVTTGKSLSGYNFNYPKYVDPVTGETAAHRELYKKMMAEPMVKAGLLSKVLAVASLDLVVTPDNPENPKEQEVADFIKWTLTNVGIGIQGSMVGIPALVANITLPKLIDGYVLANKRFRTDGPGKWSKKWQLAEVVAKPTDTYELALDEYGRPTKVIGRIHNSGEEFDLAMFVYGRHLPLYDNPLGMSDLRAAVRAYSLKDLTWKLRAIYLEKFAVGTLKGTYTNDDQRPLLEEAMQNFRSGTWIAVPQDVTLEAVSIATKGDGDYAGAIRDLEREIMVGITGAFLQATEGATTGARATGEVHRSTSELMQWFLAVDLAGDIKSQIAPDLVSLNFAGNVTPPDISFGGVNDADLAPALAVDEGLSRIGFKLSRKDLETRYRRTWATDPGDEVNAAPPPGPPMGGLPPGGPAMFAETKPAPEVPAFATFPVPSFRGV